jgi:signal peptidase II
MPARAKSPRNDVRRVGLIAAGIGVADQLTKILIVRWLGLGESWPVIPGFFHLVNWRNTGAAWGMFQDSNLVLAIISVITLLVLWFFRRSLQLDHAGNAIATGLIAGGIVGNLADRLRVGHVIDFLDFQMAGYHWPAFNVADSAICIGVSLYVLVSWRAEHGTATTRT